MIVHSCATQLATISGTGMIYAMISDPNPKRPEGAHARPATVRRAWAANLALMYLLSVAQTSDELGAVAQFQDWCGRKTFRLEELSPSPAHSYIKQLGQRYSNRTLPKDTWPRMLFKLLIFTSVIPD